MDKRHSPSADRNKGPLLEVLRSKLPKSGLVLEVASGTGQHCVHFAQALPNLNWQPSDIDPELLKSIRAYRRESALPNLRAPIELDVEGEWPIYNANAVLCTNMIHITPWSTSVALLKGAAKVLSEGACLITYGPYRINEKQTSTSNQAFEDRLRSRNKEWGVRDIAELQRVATGFTLEDTIAMPANNFTLVWRRGEATKAERTHSAPRKS